jgi:hypothetical protein
MENTLYGKICAKVDKKYHPRVKEILTVIDPRVEYTLTFASSLANVKDLVRSSDKDLIGYRHLDSSIVVFNGTIVTYPHPKVSGDFVVVLIKRRVQNPHTKDMKFENILVIHEKTESLSSRIGGIVNAGVYR